MPPKNNVNPELDPVIADPANKTCADCDAKAPRWASVNLGILMCIDCSGAHRNLGTHISVVKSVTLDKWQPKWIATVSRIGNTSANGYYENRLNSAEKPRESDSLEKKANFIRKKYEQKNYAPRNKPSPSELLAQGRDPDVYSEDRGRRGGGRDRSDSDERRPNDREDRRPRRRTPSPDERPRRQADHGRQAETRVAAAPAPPAPAKAAKAAAAAVDLLGGLDAPAAAPSPAPAPAPADNWASFGQAPAPAAPPVQDLTSLQFGTQAPAAHQPAAVPGAALPDVFAQPAAPVAPQQAAQPEQLQDQKVDYMKNALASLYHQPPENRYAAFNTSTGMGMGGNYGYGAGMSGYNGYANNPAMQMAGQVMPGAGQMPNTGMNYMGAGMQGMPQATANPQMPGAAVAHGGAAFGMGAGAGLQQSPMAAGGQAAAPAGGLSLSSGPSSNGPCGAKSGESDHAEAMKQVLDSLSLAGGSGGRAPGVAPQSAGPAGQSPSASQTGSAGNTAGSLTEIDAFSAFGKAAPASQSQPQPSGPSQQAPMAGMQQPTMGMQQMVGMQHQQQPLQQQQHHQLGAPQMGGFQSMGGMPQAMGMQSAMGMPQMGGMQHMAGMAPQMGMQHMAGAQASMTSYSASGQVAPPMGAMGFAANGMGAVAYAAGGRFGS